MASFYFYSISNLTLLHGLTHYGMINKNQNVISITLNNAFFFIFVSRLLYKNKKK